jgi:hypothetical protein
LPQIYAMFNPVLFIVKQANLVAQTIFVHQDFSYQGFILLLVNINIAKISVACFIRFF